MSKVGRKSIVSNKNIKSGEIISKDMICYKRPGNGFLPIDLEKVVGKKAKALMSSGQLVTDDIVIGIIRDRINESDCGWGFILDGFPRTIPQAEGLDELLDELDHNIDSVLVLELEIAIITQ